MDNKLITGIIGVVVVVALLGSALVPVIDGLTEGEKTTNEGAGWIRMDYVTGANYAVDVSFDAQGNVKVDYGVPGSGMTDTQTHAADEDTILFASSEMSIWLQDGAINILGKDLDDNVFFDQITESGPIAFLTKDGSGSEFNIDAGATTGLKASTWAYVPKTTGNFAFFDAGTPVEMKDYPVAAVGGGFAGVYGFNDLQTYGLGLYLQTELDEDGKLIGGTWVKTAPEELNTMEFDPSTITIQPLDPSVIDLDPIDFGGSAQLMSVPTPTYTDGDWGYDLTTVSGVQKAVIVSYSGAGGDIVVPATVGGYDVYRFGKDPWNAGNYHNVIDNSSISANSTLTITSAVELGGHCLNGCNKLIEINLPSNIEKIGDYAFSNCSGLTGDLVIPDTVNGIGLGAFNRGGYTGSIPYVDPSINIRYGTGNSLDTGIFYSCQHFTNLVIPEGTTTLYTGQYAWCKGLTGVLVIPDSVTTLWRGVFYNTGYTDVVIPSSVTTMYADSSSSANFGSMTNLKNVVIASDVVPLYGSYLFTSSSHIEEVLDLSDTVDYSVNRYGIPASATVSDSIGDAIGYVSFIEIGSDAELSGGAAALLIAVPIVVIAGLLVAFVGYSIVKRY